MAKKKKALKKPAVDERKLEQWRKRGESLAKAKNGNQWAIGDWILAGEKTFGKKEAYNKAELATGMTRATLQQFKYTAECFPISTRVKNLFFGHHRLVAKEKTKSKEGVESGYSREERKRFLKHAKDNKESVASFAAFLKTIEQDRARGVEKRSHEDVAASKVMEACDALLRSYHFDTLLDKPPSKDARIELLGRLKNAVAELNGKVEQMATAWREHDAEENSFLTASSQDHKAKAFGAGK